MKINAFNLEVNRNCNDIPLQLLLFFFKSKAIETMFFQIYIRKADPETLYTAWN